MGCGASTNRTTIRDHYRWLYCPICDEEWAVYTLVYSKEERKPRWLDRACGHWDSHQLKEPLHR